MNSYSFDSQLPVLTQQVADALLARNAMLAAAESCTGGGIAAALTDLAGSSQWFDRGFVTYSNQAKQDMLGVTDAALENHGAVSETVVAEMVTGALTHSAAQIAVAVSGIAGPSGGTSDKPVGMVCLAWQIADNEPVVRTEYFDGDRAAVRAQTVVCALQGVLDLLADA